MEAPLGSVPALSEAMRPRFWVGESARESRRLWLSFTDPSQLWGVIECHAAP